MNVSAVANEYQECFGKKGDQITKWATNPH